MSFTKEKRETIKRYMLEKIISGDEHFIKKTVESFNISQNTAYRYIRELTADEYIEKTGNKYRVLGKSEIYKIELNKENASASGSLLFEDLIFEKCIRKYIKDFSGNVQRMWEYCCTEMINNVIDHSDADTLYIYVNTNILLTSVIISDNGVGIFNKIKNYFNYPTIDDAIVELFKGKLTTDKNNHSGEGVFFSSKIMDKFAAISDEKIFSHTEYDEIIRNLKDLPGYNETEKNHKGTTVFMQLNNSSKKTNKEIFDLYADVDGGFTKTTIPIKNIFGAYPVSRSQAKRLSNRFENFEEVELDFKDVIEIGQGFAHEIFEVFQKNNEKVELIVVNANADITRMINHVKRRVE